MVAECSRALTGVGPSMASGSQVSSGNWALLPMMPPKISRIARVSQAGGQPVATSGVFMTSNIQVAEMPQQSRMPSKKATSPSRVMTKAFLPAWLALNFSNQKPIRR